MLKNRLKVLNGSDFLIGLDCPASAHGSSTCIRNGLAAKLDAATCHHSLPARDAEGWTEEVSTVELRQEVERVAEAAGAVSSYCVAESGDGTAADLTPDLLYHHVL